ncbi:MAG: Fic family protein [Desulfobacterales bacterium]|nr:Fic family protein [Desulfobacterales bacterium]MCP4163932.1 Fic family protein [Deltaproteobacteria bacterium]
MKKFESGEYISQGNYKSFQPGKVNRKWDIDLDLIPLLSEADRKLGGLNTYSDYIPNIDLFVSMHVLKEASQSNKIEGTKTNIKDALLNKEEVSSEKRDDWDEVQNYITALNEAIINLKRIPFSSRLIKNTHKILLKGVRGKNKSPGEFRKIQNFIGGADLQDATYIPPVPNTVGEYMSDLEKFAHNEDYFHDLLKIALIHYQFETIHPFLDGNGRVGRLLITLFLIEKNILKKPVLYLSDFFERNRMLYYDNLRVVQSNNDLKQWFKFFLVGVIETSQNSIETFDKILKLREDVGKKIQTLGVRAKNANKIIEHLFKNPVIEVNEVKALTGLSSLTSAYKLIGEMERIRVIKEMKGAKRNRIFLFKEYIDLF